MKINKRNAPAFCTSRHGRGKWSTLMFCDGSTYTVICSPIKTTKEIYWCPRPNNISIPIESRQQLILGDPERGRSWLGGEGKSKRARKWREYFSMPYFFHPFRLSLAPTMCPRVSEDEAEGENRMKGRRAFNWIWSKSLGTTYSRLTLVHMVQKEVTLDTLWCPK